MKHPLEIVSLALVGTILLIPQARAQILEPPLAPTVQGPSMRVGVPQLTGVPPITVGGQGAQIGNQQLCIDVNLGAIPCPGSGAGGINGVNGIANTESYDYNQSPYTKQSANNDEGELIRQQSLLRKGITEGKKSVSESEKNLQQALPALYKTNEADVDKYCVQIAQPAFEKAAAAFDRAKQSYEQASGTPYIYDQVKGTNTAQQEYSNAQNLYAKAQKNALDCQAALGQSQEFVQRNLAESNSQNTSALGQLQQQMAEQKQWEVSKTSQEGRSIGGIQGAVQQMINGFTTPPAMVRTARPRNY